MKLHHILVPALLALYCVGCATAPDSTAEREKLNQAAQAALYELDRLDPALYEKFNDSAVGVAVIPNVGKGGLIFGGAFGQGVLYEDGDLVGYIGLRQATVGAQIGGQAYSEVIFINDPRKLEDLKNEDYEVSAQATAVAITADAAKNANYDNGVAIFTFNAKGAMAEATVGGQKFDYIPKRYFDFQDAEEADRRENE